MACPMCRAHFDKHFIPQIDRDLQEEIAAAMGQQFKDKKAEQVANGEWFANKRLVKFSFGNTHEEVKNPVKWNDDKSKSLTNRWCMFMSLSNDVAETSKFIKSVTYHLHPTYRVNKIKVTEAPFLLSRTAWGYFEISMDIEFQKSTGLGVKKLTHMLEFEGNGHTQSFLLEVSNNAKDKNSVAQALAAQMDKLKLENN